MSDPHADCVPLAEFQALEQDVLSLQHELDGADAQFTEAIAQRDTMRATLQAAFEEAGDDGMQILGQILAQSGEALEAAPMVWRAIAKITREHRIMADRIDRALIGLQAANVYDGTTARILRGVA
jgi:hypothetical protein